MTGSAEEEQMRQAVFGWGRTRWPHARIMEELDVGGCRIDIAFVSPDHIAGVEIKSSRDTLDRLPRQLRDYLLELPEVWVAYHPKWEDELYRKVFAVNGLHNWRHWRVGKITVKDGYLCEQQRSVIDLTLTGSALHLLHKTELLLAARRAGIKIKSKDRSLDIIGKLARALTGDQIIAAICRQLRARPRAWRGDDPTPLDGV